MVRLKGNTRTADTRVGRFLNKEINCLIERKKMDPKLIEELLKQYGFVSAAIAVVVSFILSGIFNLGVFYVNQKIQSRHEEHIEQIKMGLEKELEEFKVTKLKESENIHQARWEMKYQACLEALDIVDSFLSHWFKDVNGIAPVRQPADTIKARNCYNKLTLTCKNTNVPESFIKVMFPTETTNNVEITNNINALRNAIRKELGFGSKVMLNQNAAWFVRLAGDNQEDIGNKK